MAVLLDVPARRLVLWPFVRKSPAAEPAIPPARRFDGPRRLGQEGGQAKIASGWPPRFDRLSGHCLTPGRAMTANDVQAFLPQHFAASVALRRRFVPPALSVPLSQSVNQRWRERPRCPASRVTPDVRDGVVHAIVGRVVCRCLCEQVVQKERAACVQLFRVDFRGRNAAGKPNRIYSCASRVCPAEASRLQTHIQA